MSNIKSKDTLPELKVRKYLFSKGLRFRLHDSSLPGKPDLIFKKHKAIIFVNGCFWHGHNGCKYYSIPKTNSNYWITKIIRNKERDEISYNKLIENGWNVIIVWECEIKGKAYKEHLNKVIFKILNP